MNIVTQSDEMTRWSEEIRSSGKRIAFVPTMGALHEGHLALMREGGKWGDRVVASIFVNPRQFDDPEDYKKYARDLPGDLRKCESVAVDAVFAPPETEVYPTGLASKAIDLPEVADRLEGVSRPGHFAGVVTVVHRLFSIVRPDCALFGQKDYQQLLVIGEMVKSEQMGVEIVPFPIVRSAEGLALSSRNDRLSAEGRRRALRISAALREGERLFHQGERDAGTIRRQVRAALSEDPSIRVDYCALVDARSLREIERIEQTALLAVAAEVESVRLIDNCLLDPHRGRSSAK